MEENSHFIFNDVIENVRCKYDGTFWSFDDENADENMVIPVRAISNVQISRVRSWGWLFLAIVAVIAVLLGLAVPYLVEGISATPFYGVAMILLVAAIVAYFFSVHYTLTITPHSGVTQEFGTRKKAPLIKLYNALVNSLHD